jgi:hypothetical protein
VPRGPLLRVALTTAFVAVVAAVATVPIAVGATTGAPDRPPVTANDFLPEERNLSDCVGAHERPGCGSEARGGWRQALVFLAVAVGLVLVFGRIAWSARRSRPRA